MVGISWGTLRRDAMVSAACVAVVVALAGITRGDLLPVVAPLTMVAAAALASARIPSRLATGLAVGGASVWVGTLVHWVAYDGQPLDGRPHGLSRAVTALALGALLLGAANLRRGLQPSLEVLSDRP